MQVTPEEAARLIAEHKQRMLQNPDKAAPTPPGPPVDAKFVREQLDATWLRLGVKALGRIAEAAIRRRH